MATCRHGISLLLFNLLSLLRVLMYIIYCVSDRFGNDFYSRGTASNFYRTSRAMRVNLKSLLSR